MNQTVSCRIEFDYGHERDVEKLPWPIEPIGGYEMRRLDRRNSPMDPDETMLISLASHSGSNLFVATVILDSPMSSNEINKRLAELGIHGKTIS
jgi:hypothetical protein